MVLCLGVAMADRARAWGTSSGPAQPQPGLCHSTDSRPSLTPVPPYSVHGSLRSLPDSSTGLPPGRRASSLGHAVLPRLGSMSGLLRPVGPEAPQTYWARRGLILGATMVLAVAVLLIIGGANIGSAVHANPSPSTAGVTMPSSAAPSSMPRAVRTAWAVILRGFTYPAGPRADI